MAWSERTEYFERLVELRVRYQAEREPAGFLSIEDAMIYAEAVMEASALENEPWIVEDAADAADADGHGADTVTFRRRAFCSVGEFRAALERWPDTAGSAGGPAGHGEHAAD